MRKLTIYTGIWSVALLTALPNVAMACPNCYGAISDSEIAQGLQLAMLALIVVTAMIGTGVVLFFSNIKKRTAMLDAGETDFINEDHRTL